MHGPFPTGTFPQALLRFPLTHWEDARGVKMKRGSRYRVIREFHDSDGTVHRVGDEWTYLASSFGVYDEVIVLFIRDKSGDEWAIHLYENDDRDRIVLEGFGRFVAEIIDPAAEGWMPPL